MNERQVEKIKDNLASNAESLHDIDAEVLLDALELIGGLQMEIVNLEAIVTNQRAEIQRMRSSGETY